jgi:S1-C subfamily serine protease/photosystem II stability/assembly factor-like uncharacterized protein
MCRRNLEINVGLIRALGISCLTFCIASNSPAQEKAPSEKPVSEKAEADKPTDTTRSGSESVAQEKKSDEASVPASARSESTKTQDSKPSAKPSEEGRPTGTGSGPRSPAATPPGMNPRGGPPVRQEDRLERIEKQLSELTKALQSMKGAPAADESKRMDTSSAPAAEKKPEWNGELSKEWLKGIRWRSIGPANMGGRIVDLAINESEPSTWWAATASGGLLKTTNNGISFSHQFDQEATVSIGAVAVAKSDANIVWVGTGENNPRNSVSYGDGVYKSVDGGKTWKNMGLKKTFQIGEIVIHPTDPNTVYVGALGRLYGPSEDRGVYKTTDGGNTWEKCFYIDDRTGVIEMQMHPSDPNTLIVTAWERLRDGFDSWPGNEVPIPDGYDGYDPIRKWGPASGIYKTTDAGKNWRKLTKGLPTSQLGRIGIDWYRKDPNILFAIVDCENIGKGPAPLNVTLGAVGSDVEGKVIIQQIYPRSPAERGGLKVGDIVEAIGSQAITSYDDILKQMKDLKSGDKMSLNVLRGSEKKTLEFTLAARSGRSSGQPSGVWFGGLGEDEENGVKLLQIVAESPAGKAGLQADDMVTEFDGKAATSWEEIVATVGSKKAGDKVKVKYVRSGDSKEVEMTMENRPAPAGGSAPPSQAQSRVYLGIVGQTAPAGGALLTDITKDGPAEKAGFMKGDVVKKINDKSIETYRAVTDLLRDLKVGDKLMIQVARATELKEIEVTAAERPAPTRPYTASLGGQSPNVQDQQGAKGFEYGGVYKSTDGGESWTRINSVHSRPMYFSVIRVDPNDDQKIYLLGVEQYRSLDGGITFDGNLGRGVHADGHALWIDPKDGKHMIIGVDGGVYVTYDRGGRWDHLNTMALGQFYHVAIAPKYPYFVYGGLQDNGTWGGPAISLSGRGPVNEDWLSVGGGDGFMCRVDPNDPDLVYWTSQNGAMGRRHMKTGERASIRPRTVEGQPAVRFNWNTPFILSNANSRVFYAAGNFVFRSLDRGNNLEKISPEITLTKRGSATALAESPRDTNVLYVGTDDGALWVTKDGGKEWVEIGKGLNLPAPRWVSTIEASRFADGRVYVCLDGHRSNDDEPYLFVSEDYGKTWRSIRSNIPWGSTRCLRESPVNENVLLVGTEFAVYASGNRGGHWNRLNSNLPTVAVFDFAFHPNNGEVVAATHGRSLWISDISPLHQLGGDPMKEAAVLYRPTPAIRWRREASRGTSNRSFAGENPSSGATIYYALSKKAKEVEIKIADATGQVVREIRGTNEPGLHRVNWDLITTPSARGTPREGGGSRGEGSGGRGGGRREGGGGSPTGGQRRGSSTPESSTQASASNPQEAVPAASGEGTAEQEPAQRRGFGTGGRSRPASSGSYKVILMVDGKELSEELRLLSDPNVPVLNDLTGAEWEYELWMGDVEEDSEEEEREREEAEARQRDSSIISD